MADNVIINPGIGGAVIASDEISGAQYQRVKLIHGNNGVNDGDISLTNPLPVLGPITNTELRATAVPTISYEHQKTHEGRYFSGGYYTPTLGNNNYIDILISIDLESFHVHATSSAGGDSIIEIYEDTIATGGTIVNMSNHNRLSSNTFVGSIKHSPSITSIGNPLNGVGYLVGGGKNSGNGGSFGFANEFILAPNTTYLYRLTNVSGGSIKAAIHIEGYQPYL